jgi:phosphoribosylamine--glycine ligase
MKVLVIGSGGREHALIWKIAQSKKTSKIFCAPGNAGTNELAENVAIGIGELDRLVDFAKSERIDLTIVGPEAPLIAGITDLFEKNKLPIVGPTKRAARIEGSKIYAKKLLLWNKIPTAKFACFDHYKYAAEFLKTPKYPLVIKAEGQCLGKGVMVCKDENTAQKFIRESMVEGIFKDEGRRIVIEEYLEGKEISFMVATDGKDFVTLLPSQDHKPAFDGDRGSNTGGMGAYAPVPFVDKKLIKRIEEEIVRPILKAMAEHNNPYRGILYPGLILTKDGPKVLEFNCRLGDPETQPVLSLLDSDIIDLFDAIIHNKIKNSRLKWKKGAAVCVVLASKGYPGEYKKGIAIHGLESLANEKDVIAFHAGTKTVKDKVVTNGGRVLGITSFGHNLNQAIKNAYKHIGKQGVHFSGMQYRRDIGIKGLKKSLWK